MPGRLSRGRARQPEWASTPGWVGHPLRYRKVKRDEEYLLRGLKLVARRSVPAVRDVRGVLVRVGNRAVDDAVNGAVATGSARVGSKARAATAASRRSRSVDAASCLVVAIEVW